MNPPRLSGEPTRAGLVACCRLGTVTATGGSAGTGRGSAAAPAVGKPARPCSTGAGALVDWRGRTQRRAGCSLAKMALPEGRIRERPAASAAALRLRALLPAGRGRAQGRISRQRLPPLQSSPRTPPSCARPHLHPRRSPALQPGPTIAATLPATSRAPLAPAARPARQSVRRRH